MRIDLDNELTAISLIVAKDHASTVTGTGVDISGYVGKLKIIMDAEAGTGTLDVKFQDSADDSTYADITGATFAQVTSAAKYLTIAVDTRGINKYIRGVGTIATGPFTFAVSAIGQKQVL